MSVSKSSALKDIPDIVGVSPFESPDARLVCALDRAGALGVLDVGHDARPSRDALAVVKHMASSFGVRIPEHVDVSSLELPSNARVVIVPSSTGRFSWGGRVVLAQVSSVLEARAALAGGADGLIVKGSEAAGVVAEETSFVLLQRVLRAAEAPVWVQGGIGLHTGAACIAAGARGVVLDQQLALLEDASTSDELRRAISTMDGTETAVHAGYRIYARPNARRPDPGATAENIARALGWHDPIEQLVAIGQDAALARPFAERFATVKRLVRGFRTAFDGHARHARAARPLARHAPFARSIGTEFPIAQGPMTRVSDRAAFAEAVARAGGLPFLALSLMRGAEARGLLEETRARLGSRPWGVGILGFVPPDLREEQLALLTEIRPPFALVAGGRPSQVEPLERAGIPTFLHVPSPALLDMFLKEGARRFVFEGRECGGHVGPRSSFALWDAAVERLLACERLDDVSVLFAGGVHDGLSARMVATLAAPLAARGAKIGALMGTAYLFTEEAVTSGAIGPAFQKEAIRCEETRLLETAPGHKTRCAATDYVQAFEKERARLEKEGRDAQTIWSALEQYNLGRLRVAAKGLRREGPRLSEVGESEQRREGMFMIGQVAALRNARCTIADLHRDVSDGSVLEDARAEQRPAAPSGPPAADVAIVGLACIYPDAPDAASYWSNVVLGKSSIREVPHERWNSDVYFDPAGSGDKTPSKWGGFVPKTIFDPGAYGIPPRSLAAIDPVQLLSLEVARRALDDAGYGARPFDRERASVVFGAEAGADLTNAYGFRASFPQYFAAMPAELDASLPRLTEDSFPGVLSNVIAGRIANRLDLRGVNYTVDAACASSLAAIDVACKELASGSSDLVIAGGADLHNGIYDYLMFASVHALSPTGRCRPFDARADGIALGEGVAAVVLKRLADAERDGDRVYAVLKGVGGSSDGKSLGLTAPRKEGQLRALERAYEAARVSPADVGLVEAHGTGTAVGDRTELATLNEFFGSAGAARASCTLGSVKAQIGHTKCAAGMAGLIKAALAIHTGVLPPTKNVETPNPGFDAGGAFVLRDHASPWLAESRVAAVSAFGFGGTNFHAVLKSHGAAPPVAFADWPAEPFFLHASDDAQLRRLLDQIDVATRADTPPKLRDLAASASAFDRKKPVRLAMIAASVDDLRSKVAAARDGRAIEGVYFAARATGKVAFLYPGQGSQSPGMLGELFVAFPSLRDLLSLACDAIGRIFPGTAFTPEERASQQRELADTRVAQPALGVADLAMTRLLARAGVRPDMVAGHSYGELVALAVAGAFDERTLLELSETRARVILEAAGDAPGTMAAVRASAARVREVLGAETEVTLANFNAPDQVVIAGPDEAIARARQKLENLGLSARAIPVACAFHSPVVASARRAFESHLASADLEAPKLPVYANATAAPYAPNAADVRRTLAAQIASPVRFVEQIEAMYAAGARIFVEAGPGGVLTDLVGRILGDREHTAIACDRGGSGLTAWVSALARVAAAGVDIGVDALFEGRATARDLCEWQDQRAPATAWIVDGSGARPLRGDLPDFAARPLDRPIAFAAEADRDRIVRDYLQSMRELVDRQRQVMLAYLGDGELPAVVPEPRTMHSAPAAAAPAIKETSETNGAPLTPLDALVAIVSERTGYPPHMLGPELDLEADLGIDSIKRIEIVGALRDKLHLSVSGKPANGLVEELAAVKTLRGMAALLETRTHGANGTARAPGVPKPDVTTPSAPFASIRRYVVEVESVPAPKGGAASLEGKRFAITPDRQGVASKLAEMLERHGAKARLVGASDRIGKADALVHLETLATDPLGVRTLFARAKEAAIADAAWIVAGTGLGGRFGHDAGTRTGPVAHGGVSGLLKSVAKEHPATRVLVVDLDPAEPAEILAGNVFRELVSTEDHLEIGYAGGERHTLVAAARPPANDRTSSLEIDERSVILVTGGARGITGRVALAMARRFGCRLELVGRSAAAGVDEDAELSAAADSRAIRRILAARAERGSALSLAAIDRDCRRILAAREIQATLGAIRDAGAKVAYHAVDVRDDAAFGALIERLRTRHGRIDGVVHGAGLIEDKLLCDKTEDSFDRVFATKVVGAHLLAKKLAHDARFFVMFSSIAGTFGSRGQTDYAAANDALDKLAHRLHRTVSGRVLSIGWGPWREVGMVDADLQREYERRGIALIAPEDGIERFFEELFTGTEPQVILTAAPAEVLA